jgi:micrococcal nuclease
MRRPTTTPERRACAAQRAWRPPVGLARALALAIAALAIAATALVAGRASAQETVAGARVVLNGESVRVRWSDGDSFRILEGAYADTGVRLSGYNTLESYGPVHRWGEWTPVELYALARQASDFTRAGLWTCSTDGQQDHYGRLLVDCPGLTLAVVASGFGHLFAIDEPAQPDALAAQAGAQAARLGIWAKGVPAAIVSSLHSADEPSEGTGAESPIYNRVVSTIDGSSTQLTHAELYTACQEVCLEQAGSCLVYVPFEQRYGAGRAQCLYAPRADPQEPTPP